MVALQHPLPGSSMTPGRGFTGPLPGHTGIDLSYGGGSYGKPVVAAAAGVARRAYNAGGGLGVVVDHGGGVETGYWHLSRQLVTGRQAVAAGAVIGRVGASGTGVRGAHLHFEVKVGGQVRDPSPLLGGQAIAARPELALGEITPEKPPGTYPDMWGSAGGRCDVANDWRTPAFVETLARPDLKGHCVRVTPGSVAEGAIKLIDLAELVPVLANGAVILVALILGWTGVKQALGIR